MRTPVVSLSVLTFISRLLATEKPYCSRFSPTGNTVGASCKWRVINLFGRTVGVYAGIALPITVAGRAEVGCPRYAYRRRQDVAYHRNLFPDERQRAVIPVYFGLRTHTERIIIDVVKTVCRISDDRCAAGIPFLHDAMGIHTVGKRE